MSVEIENKQKRSIYIALFTIFGLLFGLFVAGMIEVIYLKLLVRDFITYSFGLTWPELDQFGQIFAVVMVAVCGFWGFGAGKYWWKQIYVLKKFGQKYL